MSPKWPGVSTLWNNVIITCLSPDVAIIELRSESSHLRGIWKPWFETCHWSVGIIGKGMVDVTRTFEKQRRSIQSPNVLWNDFIFPFLSLNTVPADESTIVPVFRIQDWCPSSASTLPLVSILCSWLWLPSLFNVCSDTTWAHVVGAGAIGARGDCLGRNWRYVVSIFLRIFCGFSTAFENEVWIWWDTSIAIKPGRRLT